MSIVAPSITVACACPPSAAKARAAATAGALVFTVPSPMSTSFFQRCYVVVLRLAGLSALEAHYAGVNAPGQRGASSLKSPPQRRATTDRRSFHDDETRTLQMAHNALGCDGRHVFVGVVHSSPALKPECKCDRILKVFLVGGRELFVVVGHRLRDRQGTRGKIRLFKAERFRSCVVVALAFDEPTGRETH
jgi:hypothetical protein